MNYASIKFADCANGPGMRTALFVSGCRNHCKGCFNEITWDFNYGSPYTDYIQKVILDSLLEEQIDGLSILGGEPLDVMNQGDVSELIRAVRKRYGWRKTIWLYTGYVYEDIPRFEDTDEFLGLIDVMVDGPFVLEEKDISLRFRGSKNQRIIDVPESLKHGKVVISKWMEDWRNDD